MSMAISLVREPLKAKRHLTTRPHLQVISTAATHPTVITSMPSLAMSGISTCKPAYSRTLAEVPKDMDRWGDLVDGFDEEDLENSFYAGRAALRRGDLETARDYFWDWIIESPSSPNCDEALHSILVIEYATDRQFESLRRRYLALADSSRRAYPELAWNARQMAVQCLLHQNDYENGLSDFYRLADDAPNELARLYVELDIPRPRRYCWRRIIAITGTNPFGTIANSGRRRPHG